MEQIKEKIRTFLLRFLKNASLEDDEDIFASGFVNSLFAMQLVMFVEKEFDLSIENEDLNLDNFRTVNAICELISFKMNK